MSLRRFGGRAIGAGKPEPSGDGDSGAARALAGDAHTDSVLYRELGAAAVATEAGGRSLDAIRPRSSSFRWAAGRLRGPRRGRPTVTTVLSAVML
jgi:hypothetical protein